MRQEFERHRYVNQIGVVDVLLFQSHAEYQVRCTPILRITPRNLWAGFKSLGVGNRVLGDLAGVGEELAGAALVDGGVGDLAGGVGVDFYGDPDGAADGGAGRGGGVG